MADFFISLIYAGAGIAYIGSAGWLLSRSASSFSASLTNRFHQNCPECNGFGQTIVPVFVHQEIDEGWGGATEEDRDAQDETQEVKKESKARVEQ